MDIFANPLVIGLLVGLPSVVLGYLGYRRARKADVATDASVAIGQIIDGLNQLVDNLQIDNKQYRVQLAALQTKLEGAISERDELRRKLIALGGMACIVALLLLGVTSVKQDQERLVNRAAAVARVEAAADTQQEVDDRVEEKVEALGITTTTLGPPAPTPAPTTTAASLPPTVPTVPSTTTTTTTAPPVTVPTTITIPVTVPTVPVTLP